MMEMDDRERPRLGSKLEGEVYPGTEVLIDLGTSQRTGELEGPCILVPQPSEVVNDPLNWSRSWKFSVIFLGLATTSTMGLGPIALAPMFPNLMTEFDSSLKAVVQFSSICILVLGFSNFFWVPLSETFGRRPTLILSLLICLCSNVWRAKATSYASFLGACALNGFGAGPSETLQPQIITDVLFLHERGFHSTMYFACYFGSTVVGPIIAGVMTQHVGWRNFWWLNVAVSALIIVLAIFAFPETKWHQRSLQNSFQSQMSVSQRVVELSSRENNTQRRRTSVRHVFHSGYPSTSQFRPFQIPSMWPKLLLVSFLTPWRLFFFPIIDFASCVVAWSASCFLTANLTQSEIFAAPPYSWSTQSVGFTNFALLVGAFLGLATNGPLSDWISMRATKSNQGIREPEMRLPAMIPYVLLAILSQLIIAFGYDYKWDWKVIVIVGYTCSGIQVAALPAIVSTYAVDSYKPLVGSTFITITVIKNLWGYGYSKFITSWTEKSGYIPPIVTNMCLTVLWCAFGFVFFYMGKRFRKWTAKSSVWNLY